MGEPNLFGLLGHDSKNHLRLNSNTYLLATILTSPKNPFLKTHYLHFQNEKDALATYKKTG
jgi:hypothetical protein